MSRRRRQVRAWARCRGSVYLLVLGASALVTVIGVSALLAVQVTRQAAEGQQAATAARYLAHAAAELALLELANDPNWRTTYSHDTWQPARQLGAGTIRFKLRDMANADLGDDADDLVQLIGQGSVDTAVRTVSVTVRPPNPTNLLTNGDMEDGTTAWWCYPSDSNADIEYRTDVQHDGAASLRVKGRDYASAGLAQSFPAAITQGSTYDIELWVRMRDTTDTARLYATTVASGSGTTATLLASAEATADNWVKLRGTWSPTWSGSLSDARIVLITTYTKRDFYVDSAAVREASDLSVVPIPGTWAQQVE